MTRVLCVCEHDRYVCIYNILVCVCSRANHNRSTTVVAVVQIPFKCVCVCVCVCTTKKNNHMIGPGGSDGCIFSGSIVVSSSYWTHIHAPPPKNDSFGRGGRTRPQVFQKLFPARSSLWLGGCVPPPPPPPPPLCPWSFLCLYVFWCCCRECLVLFSFFSFFFFGVCGSFVHLPPLSHWVTLPISFFFLVQGGKKLDSLGLDGCFVSSYIYIYFYMQCCGWFGMCQFYLSSSSWAGSQKEHTNKPQSTSRLEKDPLQQ